MPNSSPAPTRDPSLDRFLFLLLISLMLIIGDKPCPYNATVPAPICGATRSVEEIAVCEQAWYPVWVSGQITLINRRGDFNGRTDWSR